jgi:1-phosphofructokinase
MSRAAAQPRFVAVALNPAVDRTVEVERFDLGAVVRGRLVFLEAAGKGVNAAHTLAALGHSVTCAGFVGRAEAAMFRQSFAGTLVRPDFVTVRGFSRQSVTILDRSRNQETHLTEQGFEVSEADARRLFRRVLALARPGRWVMLNGRPAPGFALERYAELLLAVKASGARMAVDTSGAFLRAAVQAGPDFIKPNEEELSEFEGRPLRGLAAVVRAARRLTDRVRCVVVSLGRRGAVAVTADAAWAASERGRVRVVHTVGSGDALASGFAAGLAEGLDVPDALRLAVACGGACVRSPRAALRARAEAEAVLPRVAVRRL